MIVRIEGLNHVVPIEDPVPFFGGLVATVAKCMAETHDDTPVEVFVKVFYYSFFFYCFISFFFFKFFF